MRRRACLAGLGVAATAGCVAGAFETTNSRARPDAVSRPTHEEGMRVVGTRQAGDLTVVVTYGYPHRFWTVERLDGGGTGRHRLPDGRAVSGADGDGRPERRTLDGGAPRRLAREPGGRLPNLSQRMGVHCGTNVLLPGDGDHEVTVRVGGTAVRRYGALAGPAGDSATATVPFAYRAAERDDIDDEQFDRTGARDAGVDGDETRFRPAPDPELGAHYGARLARRLTPASRSTSPHRSPATRGYETAFLATDAPDTA